MNAYELADAMEEFYGDPDGLPYLIGESAAVLRQLQKEKDELQIECDRLYRIIELNGTLK